MELVADAVRAGVVSGAEAELLLATGVLGYTVREVGRLTAADGNAAYRRLHLARASLKAWVEDRFDLVPSGSEATRRYASRGPALFPATALSERAIAASDRRADAAVVPLLVTPLEAAGLLGISRSKVYALMKAGAIDSVTVDACRRIPYDDLIAYVERLRHHHQEDDPHAS